MQEAEIQAARETKQAWEKELLKYPNVVGVDVGEKITGGKPTGRIAVRVLVRKKLSVAALSPGSLVPPVLLNNVETDVIEVGEIRAMVDRTASHKPAPGGVSVGHRLATGTLGLPRVILGGEDGYFLSNTHVIAPHWLGALYLDEILQPGLVDSVSPRKIGSLYRWAPVDFSGSPNKVDGAVVKFLPGEVSPEILEVPSWGGVALAQIGMAVQKSGRTSGLTKGKVSGIDATILVIYDEKRTARFERQISLELDFRPGDSGSCILTEEGKVVGLGFAAGGGIAFANQISDVCEALGIEIPEKVETPVLPPAPPVEEWEFCPSESNIVDVEIEGKPQGANIATNIAVYVDGEQAAYRAPLGKPIYISGVVWDNFGNLMKEGEVLLRINDEEHTLTLNKGYFPPFWWQPEKLGHYKVQAFFKGVKG